MHLLNRIILATLSSLIIVIIGVSSGGQQSKSQKSKSDAQEITLIKLEKPELKEANGQSATFKSSADEYAISKVPLFPVVLTEPRLVGIYYFEVTVKRLYGKVSIGFATCKDKPGCRLVEFRPDGKIYSKYSIAGRPNSISYERKNPTGFGSGDVVGIGLVVSAASSGSLSPELFVTVNGQKGVSFPAHEYFIKYIYPFVQTAGYGAEIEFNFGKTDFKYNIMSYRILPGLFDLLKNGPAESVIYVSAIVYNVRKVYESVSNLKNAKIVNGINQEVCSDIKIESKNLLVSNSIRIDPAKCRHPTSGGAPLTLVLSYELPGTLFHKPKGTGFWRKKQQNSAEKFEAPGVHVSHTVKIRLENKIVDDLFSKKKDGAFLAYAKIDCTKILTQGHCENAESSLENLERLRVGLQ